MRAILNVIVLSKKYSGQFYFTWNDIGDVHKKFHAISSNNNIFEKHFIKEHIKTVKEVEQLNFVRLGEARILGLNNVREYDAVFVDQSYLRGLKGHEYSNAFESISFSKELNEAKLAARNVPLSEKTT